jgi:hypothetical protein
MNFIELDIESVLKKLENLTAETKPIWGKMSAQKMIEHLTIGFKMASGKLSFPNEVNEEVMEGMRAFLYTDKPMKKEISVAFAPDDNKLIHEELELAIDDFVNEWIDFEEYYELNENAQHPHPYYGLLNYQDWCALHQKHLTHHFLQFGLL